jgi:hypothetical protein
MKPAPNVPGNTEAGGVARHFSNCRLRCTDTLRPRLCAHVGIVE